MMLSELVRKGTEMIRLFGDKPVNCIEEGSAVTDITISCDGKSYDLEISGDME